MAADSSSPLQARRSKDQPGQVQTFRSATAVVVWVVWLLFAVGNWIDLAVQGRDHTSAIAAAILLLVTGIAYDTAQRPRIIADDAGVTVRNPLRDHQAGWESVTKVDLTDLLRVHCAPPGERPRIINSWAIHYSRRRQFASDARSRRAARGRRSTFGLPYGTQPGTAGASTSNSTEAEAEKCVRTLSERATAAQAEAVWAGGTVPIAGASEPGQTGRVGRLDAMQATVGIIGARGWLQPVRTTWSWPAIAAVVIPALILLLVCLA
ncbi:MAG: PH domain-containing protein [Streptosporangiaceae bacterium]